MPLKQSSGAHNNLSLSVALGISLTVAVNTLSKMVTCWVLSSVSLCNITQVKLFVLQLDTFIFSKHFPQSTSSEVAVQLTRHSSQLRAAFTHLLTTVAAPLPCHSHFSYIINIIDVVPFLGTEKYFSLGILWHVHLRSFSSNLFMNNQCSVPKEQFK